MGTAFRRISTEALAVIVILALASIASSEVTTGYISSVEIHVDGFICATCVRTIENTLMQEEGVAEVTGNWEKGTVVVITDQDIGWVNLFDFVQRINGTRNYTVLKMNVVALGRVVKFPTKYYKGGLYSYSGDRHKLQVAGKHFILSRNDKLDELVSSKYKMVKVTGTVTAFSERRPIMQITKFKKLGALEEAKLAESFFDSPETVPDNIDSVAIHVDGFICATCVRILESMLTLEEGVTKIDADLEKGVVTITPKAYSKQVNLFEIRKRINSTRNYKARKMDVVAVGRLVKFPVRYFKAREYTHSHDRYKLRVNEMYFELSPNDKLDKLVESGHERVRVIGTVTAYSAGVPILLIGGFEAIGEKSRLDTSISSLDAIMGSLAKERKIMEETEKHAHIDSIRLYVDGFICAACEGPLVTALKEVEGVEIVHTDATLGLIEIVPKANEMLDLYDIERSINSMRDYNLLKMDVVASGAVAAIELTYGEDTLYTQTVKRYKLSAGEFADFILSENEKLEEIIKSGDKEVTVIGTVTAFRGKTPILDIRDYKKLEKRPAWLKLEP